MDASKGEMVEIDPIPFIGTVCRRDPEAWDHENEGHEAFEAVGTNGIRNQREQQQVVDMHESSETNSISESATQKPAERTKEAPRYSLVQDHAHISELAIHDDTDVEEGHAPPQGHHKGHQKRDSQEHAAEASPDLAGTKEPSSGSWRNFSPIPHITNIASSLGRSGMGRFTDEAVPVRQYEKLYQRYQDEKAQADEFYQKYQDKGQKLRRAESDIARLANSLRQVREDWNREKREMMRDMQNEATKKEEELKRQKRELSNKVFDLAGGIEYASHDQLTKMLEGWKGGVGNLSPSYFTEVDFSNALHQEIIQSSDDEYFRILSDYGGKVLWSLFDSVISNSILSHTRSYFCIGADEALNPDGLKADQTLLSLEGFVVKTPGATDANSILETWRSHTVRMLLSLIGADVRLLADYSSRNELVRKSPILEQAITTIVSRVMEDANRYILPNFNPDGSEKQKSDRQIKKHRGKLGDIVTCAVVLCLNMRLSPHKLAFCVPSRGNGVDSKWMKCVGGESEADPERPTKVLFVISPAVMKRGETGWECIVKADVFPA